MRCSRFGRCPTTTACSLALALLALAACTKSREEITLPDTVPPTVSILAPAPESVVADTVGVTIDASDDTGVRCVTLLVDGMVAGARYQAPWVLPWVTGELPDSSYHLLAAEAVDEAGNSAVSAPARVCVRRNAPPSAAILWPEPQRWIDMDAPRRPWRGAATDPDEGALPDERLVWFVDGVPIGAVGGEITPPALAPGPHAIRLEARDVWGRTARVGCNVVLFRYPGTADPREVLEGLLCALRSRDSLRVAEAFDAGYRSHPPSGDTSVCGDAASEARTLRALLDHEGLRTLAIEADLGAVESFEWRGREWAKIEIAPLAAEVTLRCEGSRESVWRVPRSAARVFLARDSGGGPWRLASWWDLHGATWCSGGNPSWTALKRAAEEGRLCR